MDTLLHDIGYALRLLRKSPGFTITAVLTLGLGMGANTIMFSVLNTVLLRPLPYPQPDRLVQIWETDPRRGETHGPVSAYNFLEWRKHSQTFSDIATYDYNPLVLSGLKTPRRIDAQFVSAGFFNVLQVQAFKGRTFFHDEDAPGHDRVVVLSYGAWSRYFDRDSDINGKSILLDEQAYTVVGVMPADFSLPGAGTEVWCLPGFDPRKVSRGTNGLFAIGRLKAGATLDQAQAEMNTIASDLNRQDGRTTGVRLVGLQEEIVGSVRRRLLVLWAAVLLVLSIACANVAGLLLARAASRQREVAIRTALGGTRVRLIRQFLTESILLAILGGVLGVAMSFITGRLLIARSNIAVPRLHNLQVDGSVLGLSAVACIVTGLAFGIAPAMHALRIDLHETLKEAVANTQSASRLNLRGLFAIAEVGLAMVLLIGSGLLTKTLWRLQQVDPGFQPGNVLSFRFSVPNSKFDARQRADLYQRVLDRLAAMPGVESVGATNDLPFAGSRTSTSFDIEARPLAPGETRQSDYRTVSPAYMRTMRMRLLAGREFSEHDSHDAPLVAIVNQAFVKKFLAGDEPLGRRLKIHERFYQVVGVIADAKLQSLAAPGDPEMYVPYAQADPAPWMFVVIRSINEGQSLATAARNAVKEVAPEEPIYRINQMTILLQSWMSPQKFSSVLLSVFAGLALVLAAIGIYGVIAYSVVERTREIGIRMALGATRDNVRRLILRQALRIGLLGIIFGAVAAYPTAHVLAGLLFGVRLHDPAVYCVVAASLLFVVVAASYFPARRATRVDPLVALRHE
jgi:putative ABC transport system permease protein